MRFFTIMGDAKFLRAFHGYTLIFWAVLWMIASIPSLDWINELRFVSHVTMATALLTSFAAWCASRVEVKQDEEIVKNS